MKRTILIIFSVILILMIVSPPVVYAHSGGTDSRGGHTDHSTGEYHYHHGYPAHQHPNGRCPYSTSDNSSTTTQDDNNDISPTKVVLILLVIVVLVILLIRSIIAVSEIRDENRRKNELTPKALKSTPPPSDREIIMKLYQSLSNDAIGKLLGKTVKHKHFGEGVITSIIDRRYVEVYFINTVEEKKFVFPDAFADKHLVPVDFEIVDKKLDS